MIKRIHGMLTSMVTPFKREDLKIDFDALMDLVSFISDHGCNGIVPLGSYGEFNSLTNNEKKQMLVSVMEARGDLCVIPNVGSDNFEETVDFARYAQGIGVDALLIMPPYFYNDIEIDGLTNYYKKILETIDIPVFLYNIPKYTGIEISDRLIDNLMDTGKIAGIHDSSGDISLIQHFKTKYPELNIVVANDTLFYEGMLLGISTFSSYLFNAFPEIVKAISFDFQQPKKGGKVAQQYLNEVHNVIRSFPRIASLKYAVTLRGIAESDVRPPLTSLSNDRKESLKNSISSYINHPIIIN
jgi:4-hydroxy-tetrahydrodipicolinate synthase